MEIENICFQEQVSTYLALLGYYNKQFIMESVVMEDGEKKSFGSKLKNLWSGFLSLLRKFFDMISGLWKKIKNAKMVSNLKKKFAEMREKHLREKYDVPAREVSLRNPNQVYQPKLTREDVLRNIDMENQTIVSMVAGFNRALERSIIQEDTLEVIIEVLDKYLNDENYSLADAMHELEDVSPKSSSRRGTSMKYYDFSNGFYNEPGIGLTEKSKPISWNDYCNRVETITQKMEKLDKLANECSKRIETIMRSSRYKNDVVLGNGNGRIDVDLPWRGIDWIETQYRYEKSHPYKYRNLEQLDADHLAHPLVGGDTEFDIYYLERISKHLAYSMNYMTTMYRNMKVEYDAIMSIKVGDDANA